MAPYVPTPQNIVRKMLELAKAGPDDVVYDLGCGDGRVLFTAVEEFNVKRAVGYEINPYMSESTQRKVAEKGLNGRVEVINENFFLADISAASIITLYLTTSGNSKLKPKFERELRPGTRVVSHDFPMHGWTTVKSGSTDYYEVNSHRIYLYRLPEARLAEVTIARSPDETNRWRRIRAIFLGHDGGS